MMQPNNAPTAVPASPMISPCSMKMFRMLAAGLPIVLRIAMSRLFSITRSTSDATKVSSRTRGR